MLKGWERDRPELQSSSLLQQMQPDGPGSARHTAGHTLKDTRVNGQHVVKGSMFECFLPKLSSKGSASI